MLLCVQCYKYWLFGLRALAHKALMNHTSRMQQHSYAWQTGAFPRLHTIHGTPCTLAMLGTPPNLHGSPMQCPWVLVLPWEEHQVVQGFTKVGQQDLRVSGGVGSEVPALEQAEHRHLAVLVPWVCHGMAWHARFVKVFGGLWWIVVVGHVAVLRLCLCGRACACKLVRLFVLPQA